MAEPYDPQDRPERSWKDTDPALVSEAQLDVLLSQAADLAMELSVEMGSPENAAQKIGRNAGSTSSDEPAAWNLDAPGPDEQLKRIDRLLTETREELGGQVAADEKPRNGSTEAGADGGSGPTTEPHAPNAAVPDFMADLVDAADAEEARNHGVDASIAPNMQCSKEASSGPPGNELDHQADPARIPHHPSLDSPVPRDAPAGSGDDCGTACGQSTGTGSDPVRHGRTPEKEPVPYRQQQANGLKQQTDRKMRWGPVPGPKPGMLKTDLIPVNGEPARAPAVAADPDSSRCSSEGGTTTGDVCEIVASNVAGDRRGLPAFMDWLLELLMDALEVVDHPFVRLTAPVRRAIGWLALATLATSAIVFAYSLV